MTDREMWEQFKAASGHRADEYEAWEFGADADLLAELVMRGEKTATASAYELYALEGEPLPEAGDYSVILDSGGEAVCIIRSTRVFAVPFGEVTEEHAFKEGEGDKSLSYWRRVHRAFFTQCLSEAGLEFDDQTMVLFEEFELVYKPEK